MNSGMADENLDDIRRRIVDSLTCKVTRDGLLCQSDAKAGVVMDCILKVLFALTNEL